MYYVIQDNLYREFHHDTLLNHLKRYDLEHEIVKFKPFTDDFKIGTDRKDIWLFGSNNMARNVSKYNWSPGSMYNELHDMEAYFYYYGKNMLNSDGIFIKVSDPIPDKFPFIFFARPSGDTKSFTGGVFTKDTWQQFISDLSNSNIIQNLTPDTTVFIAPVKREIIQEIRCWMIDGEPISMSQYKIGNRVNYLNMDHNEEAQIFSRKMARLFQPARAFVMDICLYQDEYKIVELGCMNCCGFYDIDMSKVIQKLELTFS